MVDTSREHELPESIAKRRFVDRGRHICADFTNGANHEATRTLQILVLAGAKLAAASGLGCSPDADGAGSQHRHPPRCHGRPQLQCLPSIAPRPVIAKIAATHAPLGRWRPDLRDRRYGRLLHEGMHDSGLHRGCPEGSICDAIIGTAMSCVKICKEGGGECRSDQSCNGITGSSTKSMQAEVTGMCVRLVDVSMTTSRRSIPPSLVKGRRRLSCQHETAKLKSVFIFRLDGDPLEQTKNASLHDSAGRHNHEIHSSFPGSIRVTPRRGRFQIHKHRSSIVAALRHRLSSQSAWPNDSHHSWSWGLGSCDIDVHVMCRTSA